MNTNSLQPKRTNHDGLLPEQSLHFKLGPYRFYGIAGAKYAWISCLNATGIPYIEK